MMDNCHASVAPGPAADSSRPRRPDPVGTEPARARLPHIHQTNDAWRPSAALRRFVSHVTVGLVLTFPLLPAIPSQGETPSSALQSEAAVEQLHRLLKDGRPDSSDPARLLQLANLYLEIGQNIYQDPAQKQQAFEEGARLAQQVLKTHDDSAEAHFLYAANLGSATQLSGVMASAFTVKTLKDHTQRALALNPAHTRALHMMGMMLEELPWFLGGDEEQAIRYLMEATQTDPDYHRARLDLAKLYLKRDNASAAQQELLRIIKSAASRSPQGGDRPEYHEAQHLFNSLASQR